MMNRDMTIVFIGFDGYSDMWDDCIRLYKKFWPDCPYKTLFVNNEKNVTWEGIEVLHAGQDAEWSRKVQLAIEKVDTPYICLLLEDFLVGKRIDTAQIKKTVSFIKEDNIRYFKLVNMSRAVKNTDPIYKGKKFLHVIPESDEYGVSLQAAIWNKEYLAELVGDENYNAWIFEFDRVKEAIGKPDAAKEGCIFDDRNIFNLKHGVVQSKYIPGTVKYFKKINEPLNIEREVLTYTKYYKIQATSFVKYMLPKPIRKPVKMLMEKCGMKFVSTERNKG